MSLAIFQLIISRDRKCQTRTAPHAPGAYVLPLHHIPENDHVGNRTPTPRETIWYAKPLRHTAIWLPWRLELPSTAYKAAALPIVLQKHLESKEGFEPSRPAWKAGMLSVKHHSDMCVIVFAVGTIL